VAKSYGNANAISAAVGCGSDLRGDDTFGFIFTDCKWRCGRDDNITHSTRTAGA